MGTFPELETPRLRLRYLVADDAEELLCRWSDPEVMEYLTLDPTRSIFWEGFSTGEWVSAGESPARHKGPCWAPAVSTMCGGKHRRGELGYELGKASWSARSGRNDCRHVRHCKCGRPRPPEVRSAFS